MIANGSIGRPAVYSDTIRGGNPMNRKSRYGIAAAIVASSVIAASAAYAVAGGDGTRPVPAFHSRVTVPTNTENGHVSVNPCRAVDTRHGGGAIATAHSRTFSIIGTNL